MAIVLEVGVYMMSACVFIVLLYVNFCDHLKINKKFEENYIGFGDSACFSALPHISVRSY